MRSVPATVSVLLLASLAVPAASVSGQDTAGVESYRRAVRAAATEARAEVRERGRVFLDTSRTVERRLAAVEGISGLIEPSQLERAKELALDAAGARAIRIRALQLARTELGPDREFLGRVLRLMTDRQAPRELRRAASEALRSQLMGLVYRTDARDTVRDEITVAYRRLLDDPDPALRRDAFGVLTPRGDSAAVGRLVDALRSPAAVPLELPEVIRLLGPDLPREALPAVDSLLRASPSVEVRIEAVRLLGAFDPARPLLVELIRDAGARPELRLAAARALAAGAPGQFLEVATPLVRDDQAPVELRIYAIEAIRQRRLTGDAETLTRSPDAFDRAVLSLADAARSDRLRAVASRYVRTTYLTGSR